MKMKDGVCRSSSGTHGYMAPELYTSSREHGIPSECFSLGVIVYEFLTGSRPFHEGARKKFVDFLRSDKPQDEVQEFRIRGLDNRSPECQDFVSRLLRLKPEERLGYNGGIPELKDHPWFAGYDWDSLLEKKIEAPFIPNVGKVLSPSHYCFLLLFSLHNCPLLMFYLHYCFLSYCFPLIIVSSFV